ncbi:hypothetical protein G7Z17_g3351 [Cylindrodendrum hubeiense]|uniref:Uncharacterized protein n=1 Tax=Cylindrodendrum hubeiense TaxID=595255 RepID=A0A9P5HEX7_9HYPO|nr:hypothetical protein G7Z17_g3351 [Cylindrodendrum hubeiense]
MGRRRERQEDSELISAGAEGPQQAPAVPSKDPQIGAASTNGSLEFRGLPVGEASTPSTESPPSRPLPWPLPWASPPASRLALIGRSREVVLAPLDLSSASMLCWARRGASGGKTGTGESIDTSSCHCPHALDEARVTKAQLPLPGLVCSADRVERRSRHLRLSATPNQGPGRRNGMGGWMDTDGRPRSKAVRRRGASNCH